MTGVQTCALPIFRYTVTNGDCSAQDEVTIKFFEEPTNVTAGTNDEVCGLTTSLDQGYSLNCASLGTVETEWTYTGPSGATATLTLNGITEDTDVEVSECGEYTFTYWVDNGPCDPVSASVTIKFYNDPTGVVANTNTDDTDICIDGSYTLIPEFDTPACFGGDYTTSWSVTPATGTVVGNVFSATVCGEYTITYTVDNGVCPEVTDNETIKVYEKPAGVTANTSSADKDICITDSYTLIPDYTTPGCFGVDYTTEWSVTPSTGTVVGDVFSATECGTYTIYYTVDNGVCDPVTATETINVYEVPSGVNANTNTDEKKICVDSEYTLMPFYNTPACFPGAYTTSWSVSPATGTVVGNVFSATACGEYTITYTVDNGICPPVEAYETIKVYEIPAGVTANTSLVTKEICLDGSYTLVPDYTTPGCYGNEYTTSWSVSPATATVSGNVFSATVCGEYTVSYTVDNGVCDPVTATETINVYDKADISFDAVPSSVCGYETSFYATFSVNCDYPATSDWSYTGPGTATITAGTGNAWDIEVSECGSYTFTFEVTNGPCVIDDDVTIEFYEIPNPDIDGDLDVFACSEVTYTVDDLRTCSSGTLNHVWSVTGGTIQGSNTGSSITVKWDVSLTSGTVSVTSSMVGNADCNDSDQITVDINAPTLAGQVKYFNGVYNGTTYTPIETYMPTPFATDISGTYPHDYFYVIVGRMVNNVFVPVSDTIKVEPYLDEIGGNLVEFMSYFSFDLTLDNNFDCDNEYVLKIWDGGLVYHSSVGQQTYAYNHTLGASYTYRNWGGGNATDALAIQLMVGNANDINGAPWNFSWVGAVTNPSSTPYGYYSRPIVDVNMSNSITALDALILNYRAVGLIAKFPDVGANQYSPDWKVTGRMVPSLPYITWPAPFYTTNVDDVPFNHSGADYLYFDDAVDHFYLSQPINWGGQNNFMNIYYTATGDINASYVPPAGGLKAEPTMVLDLEGEMTVQAGDIVNIPVTIDRSAELGAITLSMSYRKDLIEVLGTNYGPDFMNIDAENANVNIGWFSLEPNRVDAGDAIAYISVRVLAHIEKGTRLFELNANTELADAYAHVIEGVSLKSVAVFSGKKASELNVNNYPNPFSGKTTISYNLPEAGNVQIVVYNQIGQVVSTLMNEMKDAGSHTFDFNNSSLKPGVYQYRVTLTGASGEQSVVKRMIVVE